MIWARVSKTAVGKLALISALILAPLVLHLAPQATYAQPPLQEAELDFGASGGTEGASGDFSKFVPQGGRAVIGTIPTGIKNLNINLTAEADLDIELWDGDTFVVGWQSGGVNALIYGGSEISGDYNGVAITWSGWNGVNGQRATSSSGWRAQPRTPLR